MQIKKITLTLLLLLNFMMLLGCNINGNISSTNKRNTEYNINYHLFGGENRENIESYNELMKPFTLLDPVRTSCTFDGWYLDSEYINPVTVIDSSLTGDLEIYAKWVEGITENSFSFDLGIGKEYVLYHISDLHVISDTDSTGTEKERNRVGTNGVGGTRESYAKEFNEAYDLSVLSTSSIDNYYKIMSYINSKNPDGICITGDLIDYSSTKNYAFLNDELSKISVPFIWTIGNHENPPSSFDGLPGIDTPDFTVLDFEDFKIISLNNTNQDDDHRFCYNENQYNLLKEEIEKGKPIIIIEHVPIVNDFNANSRVAKCGSYYYMDRRNCNTVTQNVIDLICNSEQIKLVLAGHIHGETVSKLAPGKNQITVSSALMGVLNRITIY